MIVHTEAIVLKTFDFRETSRIAIFFTKDCGKLKGVLKGIRKDQKKFGSSVDRFSINDIVFYRYSRSDLHLISQCDLKEYFFSIRQDYERSMAANYVLELVDRVMPPEHENEDVYQLMLNFLRSLDTAHNIDKLVHIFQIKILGLSGFKPHLDSCVKSGKKIKGRAGFSHKLGGLISPEYITDPQECPMISPGTVASILYIERNKWDNCCRLGLTANVRKELKFVLNNFLVYHLERDLKTAKYL